MIIKKGGDNLYKQQVRQAVRAQQEAENAQKAAEKALKEAAEQQQALQAEYITAENVMVIQTVGYKIRNANIPKPVTIPESGTIPEP